MTQSPYILSVPIGRGHWITLVSNRRMEAEHFARLEAFLDLQKEIFRDPDNTDDPGDESL